MFVSDNHILDKFVEKFFFFLFSAIPLAIIIGPAATNINVLLIDIFFLILIIYKKNLTFFKSKTILLFFALYIYLIFNSLISINSNEGFLRSFGFIRFIILFAAFNFFFSEKKFLVKIFNVWLLIISIVIVDVLIESYFERNIFGYSGKDFGYGARIVSFFKDEPVVGSFLNGFFLVIFGFLLKYKSREKNIIFILLYVLLFIFVIFLTGERSTSIKAFLSLTLFLLLIDKFNFKIKLILISFIFFTIIITILNSNFLKIRFSHISQKLINENTVYLDLYLSGFKVFQNNKLFGVGNKNYRVVTCDKKNFDEIDYACNTHPHQIYLEFLSEHGVIGSFVILFIIYKLIFSKIIQVIKNHNYIQSGSLLFIIFIFTPLIPSGAFFSSNNLTFFFINLSIFYACDKKSNIFSNLNKFKGR
jgi:O-antigen ligase